MAGFTCALPAICIASVTVRNKACVSSFGFWISLVIRHSSLDCVTAETMDKVSYLIFDCEAIADGDLVTRVRYPLDALTGPQAIRRYRDEVLAERGDGKDILPVTFMLPISVAVAKVDVQFRLLDLSVLDAPQFRPH